MKKRLSGVMRLQSPNQSLFHLEQLSKQPYHLDGFQDPGYPRHEEIMTRKADGRKSFQNNLARFGEVEIKGNY